MSAAERGRFLANADADAGRLTLLVSRLLDLARADMVEARARDTCDAVIATHKMDAERSDGFSVLVVTGRPRRL